MSRFLPLFSTLSLVVILHSFLPANVQAEFYKYKDSSGGLVITNKFEDVPKKYRKNVKVVWDEELVAKDPHARRMAAADAQYEQRKQAQKQEKQREAGKLRPSDGKTLVITFDEETGQLIRTME
jgi:hypothetical protein